ncbi:hypothetical protein DICVIV_14118 [Dictyocaulus viviparus]|uniref:Uncharacterized protein n=1 Tax=Dictyocaulus viviparus TaxID=29172 RepID=A0A0D8X859_DICVI|nr:hypothetical protein DICVIV_14118 [Dictyocaulus viviparus]
MSTVMSTDKYLESLKIPPFPSNVDDERIFQHPLFDGIVEMKKENAEFPPQLLDGLDSFNKRILLADQYHRSRENRNSTEEEDLGKPEMVHRMKVNCNFLMELIGRVSTSLNQRNVTWHSVEKRYRNLVKKRHKGIDKDLLNRYEKYGLKFTEPDLNSQAIKELTGHSTVTKGLNQAIFHRIHYESSSGILRVGVNADATLYSEEELKSALDACETACQSRNTVNSKSIESFLANELMNNIPPRSPQSENASCFFPTWLYCFHDLFFSIEPEYVPQFCINKDTSDSEYSSEGFMDEGGVYTDDEEEDKSVSSNKSTPISSNKPESFSKPIQGLSDKILNDMDAKSFKNKGECFDDSGTRTIKSLSTHSSSTSQQTGVPVSLEAKQFVNPVTKTRCSSSFSNSLDYNRSRASKLDRHYSQNVSRCIKNKDSCESSQGVRIAERNEIYNPVKKNEQSGNTSSNCQNMLEHKTSNNYFDHYERRESTTSSQQSLRNATLSDAATQTDTSTHVVSYLYNCKSRMHSSICECVDQVCCDLSPSSFTKGPNTFSSMSNSDEQACLRIIRNFAYLYRNEAEHGFRPLQQVLKLLPTLESPDYWAEKIKSHLDEVGVATIHKTLSSIFEITSLQCFFFSRVNVCSR